MRTECVLILALAVTSHAQLLDALFPFASQLTHAPILQRAATISGDLLANSLKAITSVPIAVSRLIGVQGPLPTLISGTNKMDYTDQVAASFKHPNEDARLGIEDLINKYGYSVESHEVVTEDGYLLTMFRIPGNGSVVFLMHGLVGSADDYIIAGPDNGLAYLLSNEGYDVWLGNARGNKYCRQHNYYKPSDAGFWDFSWHEIGYYDLPTMIDYVLEETEQDELKYVGHSQGTTSFFVMASTRPEYNQKISIMIALSPVAFMSNVRSPIVRLLAPGGPVLHAITTALGIYEFFPDSSLTRILKNVMCGHGELSEILCSNMMLLVVGFSFDQLNVTNLPVLFGHMPSGAAVKQFVHYGQGVISGDFRRFDYGHRNTERYGGDVPPRYEVENIKAPVCLFYSDADWLAHPIDVEKLYRLLPNVVVANKVPFERFNHLDFLLAKDFKPLIYERVRQLLSMF